MTFRPINYDGILPWAEKMTDDSVLATMDTYLQRIMDGYTEQMKLHYSNGRYIDLTERINHWSRCYMAWLSYVYSNRSWRVWSEHFNRWPAQNDALPAMYRSEPQTPAFLPQPR